VTVVQGYYLPRARPNLSSTEARRDCRAFGVLTHTNEREGRADDAAPSKAESCALILAARAKMWLRTGDARVPGHGEAEHAQLLLLGDAPGLEVPVVSAFSGHDEASCSRD